MRRPSVLAPADQAAALPRLGGMARPTGVVIVSERYWAFAGRDGSLREGSMPQPPAFARRLPLVRGLARLALALSPIFRRGGVARFRERAFIAGALAAPLLLFFAPSEVSFAVGGVLTAALMFWLLRGRTLALHGAEHRAIAAAERRELVSTWEGEARPSRFSPRCGTNFAALAMPVTFALDRWLPLAPTAWTPVAVTVLSLALTMELWQFVQRGSRAGRLFLVPGLALQRLTTREPALEETQVALRAVASVLQRELPS